MFSIATVGCALALLMGRTLGCGYEGGHGPTTGEVAVTEVMAQPSAGQPEWVELRNLTDDPVDLTGCCLGDGGESDHVVFLPDGLTLRPRHRLLVAEAPLAQGTAEALVLGEDALVLDQDDPTETLDLYCPRGGDMALVDQIPLGALGEGARGHSWMVADEVWASVRNDDPLGWCLAPAELSYPTATGEEEYGTPGQPNQCELSEGDHPLPDEVVITEIMVAPDAGAEWFEVRSLADEPLDLAGCTVTEGGDGTVHEHTLTSERGTTVLEPGGLLVLCDSSLELVPGGAVLADYEYTSLTFNNADPEDLVLTCDGEEVARASYDWADAEGDKGQSLTRDPDVWDLWCLAADPFWEQGEQVAWGSPGQVNPSCDAEPGAAGHPGPGEVTITELMIAPSSGERFPEWFEVLNTSDRSLDLDGCRVEDDGHAGDLSAGRALAPGHLALIAASPFDPTCALDVLGEYGGSVTFNNGSPDRCALVCPDAEGAWVVVDEVAFDWESWDLDKGVSLILDTDAATAASNDDPGAWCPAPTDGWSCTVDGYTDVGTPLTLPHCS
jgi:hypothetical protein